MRYEEPQRKLKGLGNLIDLWRENPQADADKILSLIEDILYEMPEIEEKSEQRQVPVKEDFDERYDLVGKNAKNARMHMNAKYLNNPYRVPIGVYQKCPTCGKIGVSNIKITPMPNNTTAVYQRFLHSDTEHRVRLETFDGTVKWQDILDRKLKPMEEKSQLLASIMTGQEEEEE